MANGIKVGVLTGANGAHLSAYFPALAEAAEAESVVVCDPSGKSEEMAKKALGNKLKKTYLDYPTLLKEEQPAMVLVSLEAVASPPVIEAALDANCHVLAEKPSCIRAEDFAPLVRKAQAKHRHLMLALANRISPPMVAARKLLQEGAIGKLYGIELHIIADQTRLTSPSYPKSWFAQKSKAGGGHLIWLGIHWLDLAMYLTGAKINEVAGFAGNVGGQPIEVEDSAAMALKFDNGTFGTITSGYYLDKGYHSHIKIWGSQGWIHLEPREKMPLSWYSTREGKDAKIHSYDGPLEPTGYTPFVIDCVRASAGLQDPPVIADDSLRVLETVFACYKAAETGQTQKVRG